MLSLTINNPVLEDFYKKECNSNKSTFVDNIAHYIEIYNIKQSVKRGLEEVKLQNSGKLEKKELKHVLDEI